MSDQFPGNEVPEEPPVPNTPQPLPGGPEPTSPYGAEPPASYPGEPSPYAQPQGQPMPGGPVPPAAPYPGQYQPPPGAPMPYPQQPAPATDGLALASLITGLLGMGLVPLILGIVSLKKIKKSGAGGRGLAIAGIVLGALELVAWTIFVIIIIVAAASAGGQGSYEYSYSGPTSSTSSPSTSTGTFSSQWKGYDFDETKIQTEITAKPELGPLYTQCSDGAMASCDDLFMGSEFGSELEKFGDSCGGIGRTTMFCDDQ